MCVCSLLILKERRGRFSTIVFMILGGGVQVIEIEECGRQNFSKIVQLEADKKEME